MGLLPPGHERFGDALQQPDHGSKHPGQGSDGNGHSHGNGDGVAFGQGFGQNFPSRITRKVKTPEKTPSRASPNTWAAMLPMVMLPTMLNRLLRMTMVAMGRFTCWRMAYKGHRRGFVRLGQLPRFEQGNRQQRGFGARTHGRAQQHN
jgi:hypothetical protein